MLKSRKQPRSIKFDAAEVRPLKPDALLPFDTTDLVNYCRIELSNAATDLKVAVVLHLFGAFYRRLI